MLISSHNLLNLPVYTKSNINLGKVTSFDIDTNTHSITKYHVKSNGLLENIIHNKELVIDQSQVISVTNEKMAVEDGLEKEISSTKKEKVPTQEPVGVMSSSKS